MERGMNKIVIVKNRTRLEELVRRYNTIEQAKFYIEHLGADFSDYVREDRQYKAALEKVAAVAKENARVLEIDKEYIPNMIFGEEDIVIAVGRDGLVTNVMKYLNGQPLIGVNPDTARWEGDLLKFEPGDMEWLLPMVINKNYSEKKVTMAKAQMKDGQILYAVNDFFVGVRNHTSARYHICYNGLVENQSSSGVIISTGFGMTGWHKSIMAEFRGMAKAFQMGDVPEVRMDWDADILTFQVREPYASRYTEANLVYGNFTAGEELLFVSEMPEDGVVFSDGMLEDALDFNSGMELRIGVADRFGNLVVN
ncbi:MAG: sugar kinase [Lachnospiraceae bacterium]|nr:sugar kinase [Lachnospiraceae bacterium]